MALLPPHPLFLLVELNIEDLNERLTRAYYRTGVLRPSWDLWVAGNVYEEALKESDYEGTVVPISPGFKSPWVGKSVRDCAKWLQAAPEDQNLNLGSRYFTAIDAHCKSEDTILVCRWFVCGGVFEVEYFPQSTTEVTMYMFTNWGDSFEDRALNYQDRMRREGKPDRSKYVWNCTCEGGERCLR